MHGKNSFSNRKKTFAMITYMQVTEINRAENAEHYGFVHADITG